MQNNNSIENNIKETVFASYPSNKKQTYHFVEQKQTLRFRKRLWNKMNEHRPRTALILYICGIIIFSYLYYRTYNSNNNSFVFAKDIYQTKLEDKKQQDSIKIYTLEKISMLYDSIDYKISENKITFEMPDLFFARTQGYKVFRYRNDIGQFIDFEIHNIAPPHNIAFCDSPNVLNRDVEYKIFSYPYDSSVVIKNMIAIDKKKIDAEIDSLNSKQMNNIVEWHYFDFLYFSIITQTTIGYGDILPNTTYIRFLVSIQALLGIFCTVFFVIGAFEKWKNKDIK
ncbi:MAG: potassium channel family protein [Bacteroidales bacterium]|jgi:hypothetical protein|nr:potassium channel family protein [Bacteroidales bacterium]